jgi:uncharacterized peroxidase-related enzyme
MFLAEPPASAGRDAAYQADRDDSGYVDNLTRLWTWRPDVLDAYLALRAQLQQGWELDELDRAVLVVATASARKASYCSLAWGNTLAGLVGEEAAAQVLTGRFDPLPPRQAALAAWASAVATDPNSTRAADVDGLRACGLSDQAIFEATAFVAVRLMFASINDALGAEPDLQLAQRVPGSVRAAVHYGRPPATTPSE